LHDQVDLMSPRRATSTQGVDMIMQNPATISPRAGAGELGDDQTGAAQDLELGVAVDPWVLAARRTLTRST
jgi:hypothetical protein